MKSNEKFLHDYLNSFTPVGEETEGQNIWVEYMSKFVNSVEIDPYGTAYGIIESEVPNAPIVAIEAHCDEVCHQIVQIEEETGYLRVSRNGGADPMICAGKSVVVRTHDGIYHRGVFGSTAVHTRGKYTVMGPEQHELWIDMGLDGKGVKKAGIEVGNMVIFDDKFSKIGNYWCGRALDNRIGGYIISQVANKIKKQNIKLPFTLYFINSTQEEVGLHGAIMIAQRLKPDLALVHDVCHDTHHGGLSKAKEGDIKAGSGPSIQYTAQNHRKVLKKIRQVASEKKIPLQLEIGSYGNDTMGFFLANGGTPTAIISSPLKHMHCPTEMVHVDDVNSAIKLFLETLKAIDVDFINDLHNRK